MVLQSLTGTTLHGLQSDGAQYVVPATLEVDDIDPATIEVTHFYGLDEVRYEGAWHIALGLAVKWPYLWLHSLRMRNTLAQRWFNLWPLRVGDRLDVLRDVVKASEDGTHGVGALELMSNRHGNRWVDHPAWREYQRRLDAQLRLLADAGDLTTNDYFTYQPTGQGVRTLDERHDASRKHGANWWVQVALGVIALAAAVFTAAQTGFLKLPTVLDLQGKKDEQVEKPAANQNAPLPAAAAKASVPAPVLSPSTSPAAPSASSARRASAPSASGAR
ncbi:MAG TPA: hypothetical protein VF169_15140 [Albitalea sp.]|uniref:hypothetical protein n=1 Tax=Piscinibacter sp. TaxID=1903157 RepID=UPI002ED5BCBA